jgi:uncharacterized protein YjbI with pentapeptide repeats
MTPIPRWSGFAGKTLWDWLQLLVIPLALAAVAFGLNYLANQRDQQREDRRAAVERLIASDRRREDALGVYMQQMSDLMLQRGLLTSEEGSEVTRIARTLTLSVLRRLDGKRKGFVLQFLNEAHLIDYVQFGEREEPIPKVALDGADLRGAIVHDLIRANLDRADLQGAVFRGAFIGNSVGNADLRGADLRTADVSFTVFQAADLRRADLRRAEIVRADFAGACMTGARLSQAKLVAVKLTEAAGHDVDLSGATLERMNLRGGSLADITLTGAHLIKSQPPKSNEDPATKDPNCVKAQ